jgi:hypothetical protein
MSFDGSHYMMGQECGERGTSFEDEVDMNIGLTRKEKKQILDLYHQLQDVSRKRCRSQRYLDEAGCWARTVTLDEATYGADWDCSLNRSVARTHKHIKEQRDE